MNQSATGGNVGGVKPFRKALVDVGFKGDIEGTSEPRPEIA